MFLDRVKIWVRAGDGGDGAATFRQEAHVPRGGPDGGDGGRGGSVYLRVDAGQTTLRDFGFRHHFKATPGGRGSKARRHGKAGTDLYLDVPPGTAIYDDDTGELHRRPRRGRPGDDGRARRPGRPRQHPLQDVDPPGPQARPEGRARQRALAPPRAPAHRRHRPRRAAERRQVHAARRPDRGHAQDRRLPVHDARTEPRRHGPRRRGRAPADDRRRARVSSRAPATGPASGHAFLRHVERTRILVHVVDGSGRDPAWDFDVIREELRAHDPALLEKPMLVAFNKLDQPAAAEAWPAFRRAREAGRADRRGDLRGDRRGPGRLPGPDRRDAARRRRPGRAARTVRRGRPSDLGDGRRLPRRARGGRRLPRPRALASSGSPTRPTSMSRSRPSASSATWPASASMPNCAAPASRPATSSGSAAPSWSGAATRGRSGDGRCAATCVAPGSLGRPRRDVRSHPHRPSRGRRGGARIPGPRPGPVHPGRPAAPQAGPGRDVRRGAPRDDRARDRRQPGLRGQPRWSWTATDRRTRSTR